MDEQHSEQDASLWHALVQHSPQIVLVVTRDGTVAFANRVSVAFEGQTVVGRKVWEFASSPDAQARVREKLEHVRETRKAVSYEHQGYLADGRVGWYEVTVIPIIDAQGEVSRVVWCAHDVTERREAQERLVLQAAMLGQVNEPILASTDGSIIQFWNEAAERLLGWTAAEIVGRHSHAFLQPRYPRGLDDIVQAMTTNGSWKGEILLRKKDGEDVAVAASVRNMPGSPGLVISVFTDITERRALEEQLRQSQKMEAIGLLAGGVAHDFNNLLAVIVGFSELASRKLPPGHPVGEQLAEVFEAARRGGDLTRKLLALSRKQIIQPRVMDASAAVDDFSRLLSRILGEDVELVIERPDHDVRVRADPVQLEQVLLNLCTNARQAMPDGGTLRLSTRLAAFDEAAVRKQPWARAGLFAELTVADTGVGMDAKTRERVFEPFFTTKPEGSGLGLATVHGIVQQHGGFVHVESTPGEGTTFRVYLPVATTDDAASSSSSRPVSVERDLR